MERINAELRLQLSKQRKGKKEALVIGGGNLKTTVDGSDAKAITRAAKYHQLFCGFDITRLIPQLGADATKPDLAHDDPARYLESSGDLGVLADLYYSLPERFHSYITDNGVFPGMVSELTTPELSNTLIYIYLLHYDNDNSVPLSFKRRFIKFDFPFAPRSTRTVRSTRAHIQSRVPGTA